MSNKMSNKILNNKISNNKLLNKSSAYEQHGEQSMFSNLYLVGFILLIALIFIGYAIYYYLIQNTNLIINANSSFYGVDMLLYQPLFTESTNSINDCITMCENDIICDGITYNSKTQACIGTKNGQLRNETSSYSAWVKPESVKTKHNTTNFTKIILVGITKKAQMINGIKIPNPYILGFFSYSFNLTIYDFYKNYGSWRHIFHKGTAIDNGAILSYQSWENLITDFPLQCIGVWIAPFTNNLRIAVTTTSQSNTNKGSYPDAFIEKCDCLTSQCYITDMPGGNWVDKSLSGDNSIPKIKLNTYKNDNILRF